MVFEVIKKEKIKSINKDYLTMTYSKETNLNTIYFYDFYNKEIGSKKVHKDYSSNKYLFEEFNELNIFCKYKEIMIVHYKDNANVLVLKRIEYDYDEKRNKVKEYVFYDNLFINEKNELIHMINFKENYFFSKDEIMHYKKYKYLIKIDLFDENYISDFIQESNYYFEKGKMIYKKSLINKFKFSNFNLHFSKKKARTYSERIVHEKDFLLNFSEKNINYNDLFYVSSLFKDYLITHFNLPGYFNKHNNLYDFFHHIIYPSLENTWMKFNKKELDNLSFYDLVFDDSETLDSLVDFEPTKKNVPELLKDNSFDLIKNKSLLLKKKTNELLKEKILFFDIENNPKKRDCLHSEFNILPFILFENQGNLNQYIMNIPTVHLNKKKVSIDTLESDILIKKEIIDSNDRRNYVDEEEDYCVYKLTRREIIYLFSNRFSHYSVLENYLIKTANKRDYFDDFHLYDLLQILFKIVYMFEYKKLKENDVVIIEEFLNNKYTNIENFERDLYICDAVLKGGSLKEVIPINKEFKLDSINDAYFFKQPETSFELKLVGEIMQHCVFSYLDSLRNKKRKKEIIVLYKNNEKNIEFYPVVCLELRKIKGGYECVQAKCKRNEKVMYQKELEDIIIHFLDENNIKINTYDISKNDKS